MVRRQTLGIAATGALLLVASLATPSAAADPPYRVVIDGLNNPRGVDVAANGRVLVAETGAGKIWSAWGDETGLFAGGLPVQVSPEGEATGVVGVSAVGNNSAIVTIGEAAPGTPDFEEVLRLTPTGARDLADIGAYQAGDPDPQDLDQPPNPGQSNPYGIASLGQGQVLVTDAGNNDLLLVDGAGKVTTVARFPIELTSTAHLPPFFGLPPMIPAEAVPTAVAVGPDGWWYVTELKGFPFTPGASRIWRISPDARDVTCDPAATSGPCTSWATGFSALIDIDFGRDGTPYVLEMVHNGLAAFFLGGDAIGALWQGVGAGKEQLAEGALLVPGGVGVGPHGELYVSVGSVFPDGALVSIAR